MIVAQSLWGGRALVFTRNTLTWMLKRPAKAFIWNEEAKEMLLEW